MGDTDTWHHCHQIFASIRKRRRRMKAVWTSGGNRFGQSASPVCGELGLSDLSGQIPSLACLPLLRLLCAIISFSVAFTSTYCSIKWSFCNNFDKGISAETLTVIPCSWEFLWSFSLVSFTSSSASSTLACKASIVASCFMATFRNSSSCSSNCLDFNERALERLLMHLSSFRSRRISSSLLPSSAMIRTRHCKSAATNGVRS